MKRLTKILLPLAGGMLAVGLLLSVIGAAMGGRAESNRYLYSRWGDQLRNWRSWLDWDGHWDEVKRRDEGYGLGAGTQTGEEILLPELTEIEVDMDYGDVQIQEGEDFTLLLEWNVDNYAMDYFLENGVLKVSGTGGEHHSHHGFNLTAQAVLTVPKGAALNQLSISTDLGDIAVDAECDVQDMELSTDLGNVTCRRVQSWQLEADSDLGDVELWLPGSQGDYRWELETDLGEIELAGVRWEGEMVSGTCHGGTGRRNVKASSALGNVKVDFS